MDYIIAIWTLSPEDARLAGAAQACLSLTPFTIRQSVRTTPSRTHHILDDDTADHADTAFARDRIQAPALPAVSCAARPRQVALRRPPALRRILLRLARHLHLHLHLHLHSTSSGGKGRRFLNFSKPSAKVAWERERQRTAKPSVGRPPLRSSHCTNRDVQHIKFK
ncbi:hypothetical protein DFH07DRAFT_954740 [Mycena maculata]|uniref:Uncharacterized protein n=1 Tax=Mycena maculata TaxID=230809 RepID=A0AAD7JN61_9AGAR|nr:hypothetical protein DFH07DRAFT_954740 [Mycena maculata]